MPDVSESKHPPVATSTGAHPEVTVGSLVGFSEDGEPLVDWQGNVAGRPLPSLTTASYGPGEIGRQAALLFAGGDPLRPLIIGLLRRPLDAVVDATEGALPLGVDKHRSAKADAAIAASSSEADAADDLLVLSADKKIILKCGKASITLTRGGKVIIRGEYIVSRSKGANHLKGASIQLN